MTVEGFKLAELELLARDCFLRLAIVKMRTEYVYRMPGLWFPLVDNLFSHFLIMFHLYNHKKYISFANSFQYYITSEYHDSGRFFSNKSF